MFKCVCNASTKKHATNFTTTHNFQYERSVKIVSNKFSKVVSVRGKKLVKKVVSAGRGIYTTAVCCISASGIFVPPVLIFTRKEITRD